MNIEEIIQKKLKELTYLNIIIAGYTCSGKTTESNNIKNIFGSSVSLLPQDNYFKNLSDIPRNKNGYLMDSINAFFASEYEQDIETLLSNDQVYIPNYDIRNNKRLNKSILVEKGRINVFEGLHTIALLKNLKNKLTIFMDTSASTCLERRIRRDIDSYGINEDDIRKYFELCILPLSTTYIDPQKEMADLIIDERGKILCR